VRCLYTNLVTRATQVESEQQQTRDRLVQLMVKAETHMAGCVTLPNDTKGLMLDEIATLRETLSESKGDQIGVKEE
jgi:hypothetical protein